MRGQERIREIAYIYMFQVIFGEELNMNKGNK